MSVMKNVICGREAWKYLNGLFCVYKPSGLSVTQIRNTLKFNLCRDLNQLEKRETSNLVCLNGSVCSNKPYEVELVPNYADHELVSGFRYQVQDIRMTWLYKLGWHTSGVFVLAVNNSCWRSTDMTYRNFLRKYEVKGKFGIETKDFMAGSIVVERSTYRHVKQAALDRILASIQSAHQALAFKYSGIDIHSQAAYELASSGLVKPCTKSDPLIYSIKCTEFDLPHFTLEIHCINETEEFLAELIHDIGIDLRSNAVCTQLRQTQFGPFVLTHALLKKHWTLENILNNISLCHSVLNQPSSSFFNAKSIQQYSQSKCIEDMQEKARKEYLL